jgi:cytochrome c oxidase subunit 2
VIAVRSTIVIPSASAAAALAAAGCGGGQNMMSPSGPGARSLAGLGGAAFVVFGAVTIIVWALIAVAASRRRGSLAAHEPAYESGGQGWILIGGVAIPVVVLAVFFVLTLVKMNAFPLHDGRVHEPEIRVVGHQWWWELHYPGESPSTEIVTANELHIPVGQPVEIQLESADVIHSLWIPKLHGKVDLVPGWKNHLRIQADRPGVYEGQCSEFCGAQHARMRLLVVAETPERYALWVANQLRPAVPPADQAARRGQTLFETAACGLCHHVAGTRALGTVGPDLTHFGSRLRLGTNTFPNQRAYLAAWVTHAQSLKPGAVMPNLTAFSGVELNALVHYLEGLR